MYLGFVYSWSLEGFVSPMCWLKLSLRFTAINSKPFKKKEFADFEFNPCDSTSAARDGPQNLAGRPRGLEAAARAPKRARTGGPEAQRGAQRFGQVDLKVDFKSGVFVEKESLSGHLFGGPAWGTF